MTQFLDFVLGFGSRCPKRDANFFPISGEVLPGGRFRGTHSRTDTASFFPPGNISYTKMAVAVT